MIKIFLYNKQDPQIVHKEKHYAEIHSGWSYKAVNGVRNKKKKYQLIFVRNKLNKNLSSR